MVRDKLLYVEVTLRLKRDLENYYKENLNLTLWETFITLVSCDFLLLPNAPIYFFLPVTPYFYILVCIFFVFFFPSRLWILAEWKLTITYSILHPFHIVTSTEPVLKKVQWMNGTHKWIRRRKDNMGRWN